jgi:CheY-like chemotaxis protein
VAKSSPDSSQTEVDFQSQLMGKRLLIVDDNLISRKILALQAQSWGMIPQVTHSGSEALAWLGQTDKFDLAILDMQMPEMDGLTLASQIHQYPHYQKLPLVMLTYMDRPTDQRVEVEFTAFLNKPVKQSQLFSVLNQIFLRQTTKAEPARTSSPQLNHKLADRVPLRILLVEDNAVNQKVALHVLQNMGYRADVAGNGREAIAALYRQPYDLVLMDVQMPEMDGLEATRSICQQWSRLQRPRIVAMTANAMQGDREACLEAGMDDYMSKPIRREELVQVLSKCSQVTGT